MGRGGPDDAGRPGGPHQEPDGPRLQPGRPYAGHGLQRRDGAALGRRHRPHPRDPPRHGRRQRRRIRPGRLDAGLGQPRWRHQALGPGDGHLLQTIRSEADQLRCLAFSPGGGDIAAAGKGKVVRIWDVVTGQELLVLDGHKAQINALAFSPDGSTLASCSHDGAVKLWPRGRSRRYRPSDRGPRPISASRACAGPMGFTDGPHATARPRAESGASRDRWASMTGWHAHVLVGMEEGLAPMPTRTWACHPCMSPGRSKEAR